MLMNRSEEGSVGQLSRKGLSVEEMFEDISTIIEETQGRLDHIANDQARTGYLEGPRFDISVLEFSATPEDGSSQEDLSVEEMCEDISKILGESWDYITSFKNDPVHVGCVREQCVA